MFLVNTLRELSIIFGVSPFTLLICLAVIEFLGSGSFLSLIIGTRQVFIFGVVPVMVEASLGIFPMYFVIVALVLGICISFISFPKSISYKDRVRMVEVEMQLKKL